MEVSDPWGYQAYNKKGGKEGRGGGGGKSEHPQLPDENVQNTQKMSKHQMKKVSVWGKIGVCGTNVHFGGKGWRWWIDRGVERLVSFR